MRPGVTRSRICRPIRVIPGPLQVARALIAHKADVNAVSKSGVTALMLAAAHNNPPIVGLLLQSGADPSKRSPDKKTALDLAVENGNDLW